ncbi:hypothetical protein BJX66DRAFT_163878 [Aspergillus keveii]|uniref:Uncharacterized protein n=1 Tax=Aspergillus keveii TaxID=714993 RepID=A0ABR4G9T6_9EURO
MFFVRPCPPILVRGEESKTCPRRYSVTHKSSTPRGNFRHEKITGPSITSPRPTSPSAQRPSNSCSQSSFSLKACESETAVAHPHIHTSSTKSNTSKTQPKPTKLSHPRFPPPPTITAQTPERRRELSSWNSKSRLVCCCSPILFTSLVQRSAARFRD